MLPVIACAAFFVKAVSGFGPAIVVVAFGSQLFPPHVIIPVSALLDTTAGALLFFMDPVTGPRRFWIPLAAAIVAGSVIGGLSLAAVPAETFESLLGGAILLLGIWFFAVRTRARGSRLVDELPSRVAPMDIAMSGAGGFLGGLLGISGPPILWHFGRRFAKLPLRRTLIPLFLAAAVARVLTYTGTGLNQPSVFVCYAAALPGLLLGLYVGNRVFISVSETTFSRVVGLLLVLTGARLLLS